MNYRHQFHAGNFADVVKHVALVHLVRALQQKPKGFLYLDTHAGRGGYDLARAATGDTLARTPEWPEGIGRLVARADLPPAISEYLDVVTGFDRQAGNLEPPLRFYPGSPWLVALLARPQDRLVLCERHPSEFAALRGDLAQARAETRISVQETDGYAAIRAFLPPPERRALVLIDPPYEAQDEFVQATAALAEGLRRLPAGVFALWYPLTERARIQEFLVAVAALNPPPTLVVEVAVAADDSARKMKGCGLVIVNPPWRFDAEITPIGEYLAGLLAQEPGAGSRVTWLVPER